MSVSFTLIRIRCLSDVTGENSPRGEDDTPVVITEHVTKHLYVCTVTLRAADPSSRVNFGSDTDSLSASASDSQRPQAADYDNYIAAAIVLPFRPVMTCHM